MSPFISCRFLSASALALSLGLVAAAQVAPAEKKAPEDAKAAAPARKSRLLSPEVAAQLSAMTPKYTPEPPPAPPKKEEELPDLRETDKPRNTIIRLPNYVVQEARPPVLSERAVNTDKGLTDIALRRYISEVDRALNRFSVPVFSGFTIGDSHSSTEKRALAMYADEERLKNMADLNEAAKDASRTDPAAGAYIRRETASTYMRTSDFGWTPRK